MNFADFIRKISSQATGKEIISRTSCFGETLLKTPNSIILQSTGEEYNSLEEARETIKNRTLIAKLEQEIQQDIYENLSYKKVAEIIREHSSDKITDTLIESYLSLASSKEFSLDPIVEKLRHYNRIGNLVEDKIDYKLKDGSIVAISEDTLNKLRAHIGDKNEVIQYMTESKENFLSIIELLED